MKNNKFKIVSPNKPAGDQPKAIEALSYGVKQGLKHQTLLGVTGSGKTFTVANVIEKSQKPTLIIAHNKTLAAQLTGEFRTLFPENTVEYFVSYYDYYQPEAYLPGTDTYIEKEAQINDEIDRLRHRATSALLSRRDVIVVASVSAIYGLGSPDEYENTVMSLYLNDDIDRGEIIRRLVDMFYVRSNTPKRGTFTLRGSVIDIYPIGEELIYRIYIEKNKIAKLEILDWLSRKSLENPNSMFIFPAKHFVIAPEKKEKALKSIEGELDEQLKKFNKEGKLIEADRLERRTKNDLALIREVGYCNGIENYSRPLSGRPAGSRPFTLLDYFPEDFLCVIDESHVTISQIGAMYNGDRARKETLIEHGFRLPSALDNRPLKFEEFDALTRQRIYMSATPGNYEKQHTEQTVEQIIRPTGLVDPQVEIQPITNQVDHAISQIQAEIAKGTRVLVTTLTKKMAEDLSEFLAQKKIKSGYLHSDVDTLDRIRTLTQLRKGQIDVLVGVNLLREGLDLPEVSLVLILDADKEGFLRSETSLVQTIGRAARNVQGRVVLYADNITGSLKKALEETTRRRNIQLAYNKEHDITPKTVIRAMDSIIADEDKFIEEFAKPIDLQDLPKEIKRKKKEMQELSKNLRFEEAALLRDEIVSLEKILKQTKQS